MQIRTLTTGPLATNAYLLTHPESNEALLVDCPEGSHQAVGRIVNVESLRVAAILLTHGHWDHTVDLAAFQREGALIHAHVKDQHLIEQPEVMRALMPPDLHVEPARIDVPVRDGQQLAWWGQQVEVRHVPGHCPGNVLFYFPETRAAFVGDAIFAGGIGRYDLPGGSLDELEQSIRHRIYTLPDDVMIFPGHGPRTTVAAEKKQNPFVHE